MAMLAEPRRKQKWTLNPRGKHWSEDSNKFGQKMLEKMGWSSGKGLGANLDGMTEHIRARYKNDQAGIGFSHDETDKQWTQHQEGFNELLQKLHNGETEEASSKENELSGKSLELKSKQSRARVHYQKFTRGKDVNKYSAKDLANIFGKKDLDEKAEAPETLAEIKAEIEEPPPEPVGSSDSSHGVVTIKGGSITDYFKNKMSHLSKKSVSDVKNEPDSDCETRAGFGFGYVKKEVRSLNNDKPTQSSAYLGLENPGLDLKSPKKEKYAGFGFTSAKTEVEGNPEVSKETPRKRKLDFVFENPALDLASPKTENVTPRKRKSDFVFENPCLELGSSPPEVDRTPKRRKSDFAFENPGLDLENAASTSKPEMPSVSSLPVSEKKKRKKKSKESPRPSEGFTNEALSLELRRDEEVSSTSQFEVPRPQFGLANDALDLADETNGKKRVTFNETVEYDTTTAKATKKKHKNGGKLDKFEVDNEKLKKKRKKSKRVEVESIFVNEAMDVEILSQEASDNALNERKSERARKKRERRRSNLETIEEAPEEEKDTTPEVVTLDEASVVEAGEDLEVLSLETPKKKKKKKKKNKAAAELENQDDLDTTIDISEEIEDIPSQSTKGEKKLKKGKNVEPEVVNLEETPQSSGRKSKKRKSTTITCDTEETMEVVDLEETVAVKKEKTKKNLSAVDATSMDKENVEVLATENGEAAKKSKKQKKAKTSMEDEDGVEKLEKLEETVAEDTPDMQNGTQSPWDGTVRKSKRMFKALFARSPVVHFAGSNINEIKGYGMDA